MEFAKIPIRAVHFYNSVRRAPVGHHHKANPYSKHSSPCDLDLNSSFISCGNAIKAHFSGTGSPASFCQNITSYFVGNRHNLAIAKAFHIASAVKILALVNIAAKKSPVAPSGALLILTLLKQMTA